MQHSAMVHSDIIDKCDVGKKLFLDYLNIIKRPIKSDFRIKDLCRFLDILLQHLIKCFIFQWIIFCQKLAIGMTSMG